MNKINGVLICGKRESPNYLNTTRSLKPDESQAGICPNQFKHCGGDFTPSANNTICLPIEDVDAGLCPIVDVKFVGKEWPSISSGYEVVSAGNVSIAFSKKPTKLPI